MPDTINLEPIHSKTAEALNSTTIQFNTHIAHATTLDFRYMKLEEQGRNLAEVKAIQNRLKDLDAKISGDFQNYQKSVDNNGLKVWLSNIKSWGIEAYQEVNSFRTFITGGQTLVYDVMNSSGTSVFRLEEDDFVKLLSSKPLGIQWGVTLKGLNKNGLANLLRLQVGNPSIGNAVPEEYRLSQEAQKSKILLSNDEMYNFIVEQAKDLERPRLLELYSQVKSTYKGRQLNKQTKNSIAKFIEQYKGTKELVKDSIAFYQTGDAIQDNMTLIENKVGGSAGVSIRTVKNIIHEIAQLGFITSAQELKKRLKQLFTYSGKSDFAKKIQNGAAYEARKAINNMVNELAIKK